MTWQNNTFEGIFEDYVSWPNRTLASRPPPPDAHSSLTITADAPGSRPRARNRHRPRTDRTSACIRLPTRPFRRALELRRRRPLSTPRAPAVAAPATAHTRKNTPKTRAAPPSRREAFLTVSGSHADSSRLAPSGPSSFAGAHRDDAARAVFRGSKLVSRALVEDADDVFADGGGPRRGLHVTASHPSVLCFPSRHSRKHARCWASGEEETTKEPSAHVRKLQSDEVHPSSHRHVAKSGSAASPAWHVPWPEHSWSFADGHTPRFSNVTQ